MTAQAYHAMKSERCEEVGVRLIHVAEEDWKSDPEAIEVLLTTAVEKAIADNLS